MLTYILLAVLAVECVALLYLLSFCRAAAGPAPRPEPKE
jgi:hypothetical protein